MEALKDIRRAAFSLLARRDHAYAEILQKLLAKNFELLAIKEILLKLEQQGFLNDTRFIENYLQARRNKGFGPLRIQAELLQKGLAKDLIKSYIKPNNSDWLIGLRKLWQKRFNLLPVNQNLRIKQQRFFMQRGFTQEQINILFNDTSHSLDKEYEEC